MMSGDKGQGQGLGSVPVPVSTRQYPSGMVYLYPSGMVYLYPSWLSLPCHPGYTPCMTLQCRTGWTMVCGAVAGEESVLWAPIQECVTLKTHSKSI